MTADGAFAQLDARDAAHRNEMGLNVRSMRPLSGRAEQLAVSLRSLDQIQPVLKYRYLVKGWLDRGASSVVYGESNVGKTFFVLDISMHIGAGTDWHGVRVASDKDGPGSVVYVASEGGTGINNRLHALRLDQPALVEACEASRRFHLLPTSLDLCGSGDSQALVEAIGNLERRPALIVIDTLARSMGDGDENTAKDMGAFVRSVDHIREATGAHVLVIHHSGKDRSQGARGSSSLRGAVDTEIELTRSGAVVMAETKKQRDMPSGEVFAYTLRNVFVGKDEDGEDVHSAVVEPTEPVKKTPKLSGQQNIAMQALEDALAHHGEKKHGDMFPSNRQCVSIERWREYCDRHSLSSGESDSARRKAFFSVKNSLQSKELIRIVDDFVWRCQE